ncbi:MAG: HAD family hydrolase [Deltaproteobacteria bacterium]|nr:HAD family hydrolase [Deltaproteobacteria bacterium]
MTDIDNKSPVVFLDRDGTLNIDTEYIGTPEGFTLFDGAALGVKRLNDAGVKAMVVTNQSGLGRGYFTEADLKAVNDRLEEILLEEGAAKLDGIYYCPHHPDDNCKCRKPETGLVEQASSQHAIDMGRAFVIGDKESDILLAKNIGAKGILILTGHGEITLGELKEKEGAVTPDFVANNMEDATKWILKELEVLS